MILTRYLIKEILVTWIATTVILMLIFMSTQFVHYLTGAVIGRYAATLLFKIMLLQIPILLGLLIPVGFYGAILLAYGRLYTEREMIVLTSCGFSPFQLLKVTLYLASMVCLVTLIFSLWLSPLAGSVQKKLINQAKAEPVIETLTPGKFFHTPDGKIVLFVDQISTDHLHLKHLFLAEHKEVPGNKPPIWSIVAANSGNQQVQQNGAKYLIIHHGYQYEGEPGQGDYQISGFAQYDIHLEEGMTTSFNQDPQMMNTLELWHMRHKSPAIDAELQWRISSPLSIFILTLLALPLSQVNPRQGRFGRIIPASMIYIIYANMAFVTRSWIENRDISASIGLWWLHGLMFLLAICLFLAQTRFFISKKWRFK